MDEPAKNAERRRNLVGRRQRGDNPYANATGPNGRGMDKERKKRRNHRAAAAAAPAYLHSPISLCLFPSHDYSDVGACVRVPGIVRSKEACCLLAAGCVRPCQ